MLRRLTTIAPHIIDDADQVASHAARGPAPLLLALAQRVQVLDRVDELWLLLTGFLGVFPEPDHVRWAQRQLRLVGPNEAARVVLQIGIENPTGWADVDVDVELVVGGVIVDVDFCAKYRHNTGIQRVVRETVSRWVGRREVVLVAWTASGSCMRTLSDEEHDRVIAWNGQGATAERPPPDPRGASLVVPYRSTVIVPEVPQAYQCAPLAALAEFSPNAVGVIGYDAIPVISPNTIGAMETERFVNYLTVVKHSDRVAAISHTAAAEFGGFASAVRAQGLHGPETVTVMLPVDKPTNADVLPSAARAEPLLLCVGSQEPRKNHDTVLHAAEVLWLEGQRFTLRFIGGGSLGNMRRFDREITRVRRSGGHIEVLRGVNDEVLLRSYREARFSVFPSIHEGFGLPVAESLALGTPVITTRYGSTAEVAASGGCVLVDPRDDESVISAMRRLLTDDAELDRLREEARRRTDPTWDDYADALWENLVTPLTEVVGA
jgi:glycosyltransferase involved in cell wall biosynthesis